MDTQGAERGAPNTHAQPTALVRGDMRPEAHPQINSGAWGPQ